MVGEKHNVHYLQHVNTQWAAESCTKKLKLQIGYYLTWQNDHDQGFFMFEDVKQFLCEEKGPTWWEQVRYIPPPAMLW